MPAGLDSVHVGSAKQWQCKSPERIALSQCCKLLLVYRYTHWLWPRKLRQMWSHLRELKKRWQIMVGSLYAITETHTLQTVQANCTVGSNFTSMSNQVGVDFFRGWEHHTAVHAFLQSLGEPGTDRGQILSSLARCTLQINIIPLLKHWYHCFKVVQISTHWHVS